MVVAERILLARRPRTGRPVDRRRRAVQERLRPAAVRHQATGALGVRGEIAVEVGVAALHHREVEHGVEVVGERVQRAEGEIDRDRSHTGLLEALAVARLREPREAVDLVVARQRARHGEAHLPGRAGHQQLAACEGHLRAGF